MAKSPLASLVTFGGGTALAAVFLHHRISEDLDFFSLRELEQAEILPIVRRLRTAGLIVTQEIMGPRRVLILTKRGRQVGHVDVSHYPFDPIDRTVAWRGLRVDSLIDMTVNKIQAILTRQRPRDYVDLFFLLKEGPERDLDRLLGLTRAKFETGADRLSLAERFLEAARVKELPRLIRPVTRRALVSFFEGLARDLVKRG